MATKTYWVWCEIICSNCNRHLAGEYTQGKMPRTELETELKKKKAILHGQEAFCNLFCKQAYQNRNFGNMNVVTHPKKD